jgi:16S rRNA processing protein RimM
MGRIAATYGVKGWVKVTPFTESPAALIRYPRWWVGRADAWTETEVSERAVHGASIVARFFGCADREQAAKLRGSEVAIPRDALPEPAPNEYYWADLIGAEVVNTDGLSLGKVAGLFSNGAHDVMRVGEGRAERLIPFVGAVIRTIDLPRHRIEVEWGTDW